MKLVKTLREILKEWSQNELDPTQVHEIGSKLKTIVGELDGLLYQYVVDHEEKAKQQTSTIIERYLTEGKTIIGPDIQVIVREATGYGFGYTITVCLPDDDNYRWGVTWTNNRIHLNLLIQALTKPTFSL